MRQKRIHHQEDPEITKVQAISSWTESDRRIFVTWAIYIAPFISFWLLPAIAYGFFWAFIHGGNWLLENVRLG